MFYAKAIDLKILVALGTIVSSQMIGTFKIEKEIQKLIDYYATYPNATLRYKASGMVLKAHSDA